MLVAGCYTGCSFELDPLHRWHACTRTLFSSLFLHALAHRRSPSCTKISPPEFALCRGLERPLFNRQSRKPGYDSTSLQVRVRKFTLQPFAGGQRSLAQNGSPPRSICLINVLHTTFHEFLFVPHWSSFFFKRACFSVADSLSSSFSSPFKMRAATSSSNAFYSNLSFRFVTNATC